MSKCVATCIFCHSALDRTTSPEHILHEAFGGKKTTRRVICSDCNNRFGGGIDKYLVEQFAAVRNLLRLQSGTGAPPPALKKLKAGKEIVNIESDGQIKLVNKPFTIMTDSNGNIGLQANLESFEKIEAMIPNMSAALRIPEDRLRELLTKTEMTLEERRPDPIQLDFAFGGPGALRSAAKACLILWSTLVGNDEVSGQTYEAARRFIHDGDDDFLAKGTFLDSRICEASERIVAAHGSVFNMIYIRSNESGRVIGHFTLYNLIAFSVVLAESGGSPKRQIALLSDPLTRAWSDRGAEEFDIPFEWLDAPDYDYDDMIRSRQRLDTIMKVHFDITKNEWINRIIRSVLKGHGLKDDELIPKEMALSISKEISDRVTHHLLSRPYRKPISTAESEEIFGRRATNSK